MTIGTRQNLSNIHDINIIIDNEHISNVDSQNLPGIIIDKTLSWEKQIDSVCLNISRRITLLTCYPNMSMGQVSSSTTTPTHSPFLIMVACYRAIAQPII